MVSRARAACQVSRRSASAWTPGPDGDRPPTGSFANLDARDTLHQHRLFSVEAHDLDVPEAILRPSPHAEADDPVIGTARQLGLEYGAVVQEAGASIAPDADDGLVRGIELEPVLEYLPEFRVL